MINTNNGVLLLSFESYGQVWLKAIIEESQGIPSITINFYLVLALIQQTLHQVAALREENVCH